MHNLPAVRAIKTILHKCSQYFCALQSMLIYSLILFTLILIPTAVAQSDKLSSEEDSLTYTPAQKTPDSEKIDLEKKGRILFIGDSLTDASGLVREESYPNLIAEKINKENLPYFVQNAGVSGDTSAGGLRRLNWLLRSKVDVAVVALGINDGLRGIKPEETESNLMKIIQTLRDSNPNTKILLVGMIVSPNMGPEYEKAFSSVFPNVAQRANVALLPFLLEGVAAVEKLNLEDGMHPNKKGQAIMAESVWKKLKPLL